MTHTVPYARSGQQTPQVEAVVRWTGVDDLLAGLKALPPDKEFPILMEFLVAFAGGLELAQHRMEETLVEQAAVSYEGWAKAVQKIKAMMQELYELRGALGR